MLIITHPSALSTALSDCSIKLHSNMSTAAPPQQDNTKLFEDIDAYPWDSDAEFQVDAAGNEVTIIWFNLRTGRSGCHPRP